MTPGAGADVLGNFETANGPSLSGEVLEEVQERGEKQSTRIRRGKIGCGFASLNGVHLVSPLPMPAARVAR